MPTDQVNKCMLIHGQGMKVLFVTTMYIVSASSCSHPQKMRSTDSCFALIGDCQCGTNSQVGLAAASWISVWPLLHGHRSTLLTWSLGVISM